MLIHRATLVALVIVATINAITAVQHLVLAIDGQPDLGEILYHSAAAIALAGAYLFLRHAVRSVEAENARIRAKYASKEVEQ